MRIKHQILEDREKRNLLIQELLKKYPLVICIKVNVCGDYKNILENNIVLNYFNTLICNYYEVCSQLYSSYDGNYYLVCLDNDLVKVKKYLISIEENILGRYVDLDVYGDAKSISRTQLNKSKRVCTICKQDISVCSRTNKHTVDEVNAVLINGVRTDYFDLIWKLNRELNLGINEIDLHMYLSLGYEKSLEKDAHIITILTYHLYHDLDKVLIDDIIVSEFNKLFYIGG